MSFINPMFAAPMPKVPLNLKSGEWYAEEKIDGHRLILQVEKGKGTAWSRNGLTRILPPHLHEEIKRLPDGIYDGELYTPGGRSYGVTEIVNGPNLAYTVFDLLQFEGVSLLEENYFKRRVVLLETLAPRSENPNIHRGWTTLVENENQLSTLLSDVWERDGEGLILKNTSSIYVPGKRPKNTWIKLKQLKTAVLTVIGFAPSRGQIVDRGPYAMIILRDEDGNITTVKTRNDEECRKLEKEAPIEEFSLGGSTHPAIGRKIRIEYQERTPDGNYRHPRMDRWEDE